MWKQGFALVACFAAVIFAQQSPTLPNAVPTIQPFNSAFKKLSKGAEDFSLELFSKLSKLDEAYPEAVRKKNMMISPFSVWALLLLVTEGASDNTLTELRQTLRLDNDVQSLRLGYQNIDQALRVKTDTIDVLSMQTIFYNSNVPLKNEYENVIERDYKANVRGVNFYDQENVKIEISKTIEQATHGLFKPAFGDDDLKDAQMLMISTIYFKGLWKLPFNSSFTKEEPFYDDYGKEIAKVQMMTQTAIFNYAPIVALQSHVLELPYGEQDRLSMLLIVPKKGRQVNEAIDDLRNVGLEMIFNELKEREKAMAEYDSDEVEVFLPKFITTTSFTLNQVLDEMGIKDVFQPYYANLTKISDHKPFFLSRVIHQTKIEVSEEGTVAAAFTAGIFANKASPPRFYLNRPFAYLIVEKTTNTLLFCGKVSQPVYNK